MRGSPKIATRQDVFNAVSALPPRAAGEVLRAHAGLLTDAERRDMSKQITKRKRAETLAKNAVRRKWARWHELEAERSAVAAEIRDVMQRLRAARRAEVLLKAERTELAAEMNFK
jgi:uncharacterized protein (UPF0335 family)